jgi:hypothetical protein
MPTVLVRIVRRVTGMLAALPNAYRGIRGSAKRRPERTVRPTAHDLPKSTERFIAGFEDLRLDVVGQGMALV